MQMITAVKCAPEIGYRVMDNADTYLSGQMENCITSITTKNEDNACNKPSEVSLVMR